MSVDKFILSIRSIDGDRTKALSKCIIDFVVDAIVEDCPTFVCKP
jgi:hypothetical protein